MISGLLLLLAVLLVFYFVEFRHTGTHCKLIGGRISSNFAPINYDGSTPEYGTACQDNEKN